jgi:hypothetical protein
MAESCLFSFVSGERVEKAGETIFFAQSGRETKAESGKAETGTRQPQRRRGQRERDDRAKSAKKFFEPRNNRNSRMGKEVGAADAAGAGSSNSTAKFSNNSSF